MADKEKKGPDPLKDVLGFIGILLVVCILWSLSGFHLPTIKMAPSVQVTSSRTGTVTGTGGGNSGQSSTGGSSSTTGTTKTVNPNLSPFYGQITMQTGSVGTSNASQEYLTLYASKNNPYSINVTGWTLMSTSTGNVATIGQGSDLPFSTSISSSDETPIYLQPGDTAYVITGISPVGGSFRVNECSGYLNQIYPNSFTPSLYNECPQIYRNETLPQAPNALNNACLDYLEGYPECRAPLQNSLPQSLSYQCQQFIVNTESYGQCLVNHKSDSGFYGTQWRIYLGRTLNLWSRERETIELLDSNGKLVSKISYSY